MGRRIGGREDRFGRVLFSWWAWQLSRTWGRSEIGLSLNYQLDAGMDVHKQYDELGRGWI
jgi:hypothetical protein